MCSTRREVEEIGTAVLFTALADKEKSSLFSFFHQKIQAEDEDFDDHSFYLQSL